jgi:SlyX protein
VSVTHSDNPQIESVQEQLVDLQTRFAFQEDSLQTLNDIVTRQQMQIDTLERELILHREKLTELMQAVADRATAPSPVDERPPHY